MQTQRNWMKPNSRLPFKIASTPGCMSVGDVIRELDALQLVSSELNSNMKLENLLEEHRARKKSYRNPIMTMVLKEEIVSWLVYIERDPRMTTIYSYWALSPTNGFRLTLTQTQYEIFENILKIEFHNDLVDPYLDIGSVEVPAIFIENFDWQRLRTNFVHGANRFR
ncbi:hypothetical protein BDF21DRAFT_450900 [Thamnidium elegans]|nr:hypothetical protein BDF21DRAFT_450900 [Thamnidium elegans]